MSAVVGPLLSGVVPGVMEALRSGGMSRNTAPLKPNRRLEWATPPLCSIENKQVTDSKMSQISRMSQMSGSIAQSSTNY